MRVLPFLLIFLWPLSLWADAVDAERQRVVMALTSEPPTLDSAGAANNVTTFLLVHLKEGLLQYGPDGGLIAGVAERWQLREDGATFWLRRDARWSDGRPVTARDFIFAWRRVVDPATASHYAFIMYPIANAEKINRGELPVSSLGVRAVGDYQLEVDFAAPCPYFLSLTAFMSYYPQREDAVAKWGRAYAADKEKQLYNGPFVLSRWVHGAHLTLKKNPHYWNRDQVALNEIDLPYITTDVSAQYNLFKDGRIAMVTTLDTGTLQDAIGNGYAVEQYRAGLLYFLEFNFRKGRVTANRALRKAIQAVLDPATLVYKIIGLPGVRPAYSLFPLTVKGPDVPFREAFPAPQVSYDIGRARQWLAQAKRELEIEQLAPLVILTNDSPKATKLAEYYQYLFSQALGIEVVIDTQTFKQYLDKMRRGDFDIAMAGWGPDFDDAQTYGELFASWNENNRGTYRSDEYDHWIRIAQRSADPKKRFAAFAQLQRIVVEDVPIVPTYENVELYVVHPKLKGLHRSIFGGDPNLRFARVED